MNKSIAQNIQLMPTPFSEGLEDWSSQNGGPGSASYANSNNAQLLFTDPDFDECLEIVTNKSPQKLRFKGQTPIIPGCYLKVSARVKVVSGVMPSFEVAAWPGDENGNYVSGVTEKGPQVAATEYDKVYEISAIYGSGDRPGVDAVWGLQPVYGHFGLNVVGAASGASVRIESVKIEDVTSAYHRVMMDWVDVRDFGAKGDGVFNNKTAFLAADAAANGREVIVPEGDYFINDNIVLNSPFRFSGRVLQDTADRFILLDGLRYSRYLDAFKDETLALKKALQALLNASDHDSLDLEGREVHLDEPLDVLAAVVSPSSFSTRRVLRNGRISANPAGDWSVTTVTGTAKYTASATKLTNVQNINSLKRGMLVQGTGVGREIYIRDVDISAGEVELSKPLFGAAPSQSYTFKRFAYLLDFSDFNNLQHFCIEGVSLNGASAASCLMMPADGFNWRIHNCRFQRPKDRGLTNCGTGCFAMWVDNCDFGSAEGHLPANARSTVAMNFNSNDVRVRHCRGSRFKHFAVFGAGNVMFHSNHFFQGGGGSTSRTAGVIFGDGVVNSSVTGNYVDNCWIELTNEYKKNINSNKTLGAIVIDSNVFLSVGGLSTFAFIRMRPHTTDGKLRNITITDNTFRASGGAIKRVEDALTDKGDTDLLGYSDIKMTGNVFNGVTNRSANPVRIEFQRPASSPSSIWTVPGDDKLAFDGLARGADSVLPIGPLKNGSGSEQHIQPYIVPLQGSSQQAVRVHWGAALTGKIAVVMRCDTLD
ncbi:MAG: glycosyl hydrolase family 28-related protein [Pikeienuella sp.]